MLVEACASSGDAGIFSVGSAPTLSTLRNSGRIRAESVRIRSASNEFGPTLARFWPRLARHRSNSGHHRPNSAKLPPDIDGVLEFDRCEAESNSDICWPGHRPRLGRFLVNSGRNGPGSAKSELMSARFVWAEAAQAWEQRWADLARASPELPCNGSCRSVRPELCQSSLGIGHIGRFRPNSGRFRPSCGDSAFLRGGGRSTSERSVTIVASRHDGVLAGKSGGAHSA